ncbi:hypothetical protein RND81_10G204800 [Saponaria officinalis]|uniref:S-protein homolog n=1 Tax=Saponaria officinalis TaxID=3572 RepID=A0AAW1I4C0_SAPOF
MIIIFITILALFLINFEPTNGQALKHYGVHITNALESTQTNLTLHCKSGDDDRGEQHLNPGDMFSWGLKVNFWETTLYFCHFYWENKDISFDVFNTEVEGRKCKLSRQCYWFVKADGFYFRCDSPDESNYWVKQHDWP